MADDDDSNHLFDSKHRCIYKGDMGLNVYVQKQSKGFPVLDMLNDRQKVSQRDHDGIYAIFEMLNISKGSFRNGQKFKKLLDYNGKALLELKKNKVRIGCIWLRSERLSLMLSFACLKKEDKWKTGDIEKFKTNIDKFLSSCQKEQGD